MESKRNDPVPARSFGAECAYCWEQLPNKEIFFILIVAWALLFQFLGNATLGYINTPSLFHWLWNAYSSSIRGQEAQDDQGILIPPVVLVLFWWKRRQLLAIPARLWWPALVPLAGALLLHLVGYLIQEPLISVVALFLGLYSLMGLAWGSAWLRASFFPFFLFAFSIPTSSVATPVTFRLRLLVCKIVSAVCNGFLGIDIVREGTQLFNTQHSYSYDVAPACSGIRSLVAILALSTIFGFLTFEKSWKRLLMIAAAFPLAVLGNVLRMLGIIITADMFGQSAGNFVHENWFFSLLPYVPAIAGVLILGKFLREERRPDSPTALEPKTI